MKENIRDIALDDFLYKNIRKKNYSYKYDYLDFYWPIKIYNYESNNQKN